MVHVALAPMTGVISWRRLLRYELQRVVRAPAMWTILAAFSGAAMIGAANGAAMHARQQDDAAAVAADERAWYDDIADRVRRFSQPSPTPLPYWQDPTDAAAFSRYFLRRHAYKPHLPLSPLAVGHSDLQPYVVPLRLEALFGGDPVYDDEHPRALAVGLFDLEFVLVWLLPLGLAAITALLGAIERDQQILPLVAAQPVSARRWFAARGAAITLVVVPIVCASVIVALARVGPPLTGALLEAASMIGLIAAYTLLWISMSLTVVARGAGAVSALGTMVALWLILTAGLPLAASGVLGLTAPPPSYPYYIEDVRKATDAVQAERDVVVARALAAHTGVQPANLDSSRFDYSTRMIMLTPEIEKRLIDHRIARERHTVVMARAEHLLEWMSPQLAFRAALETLAGTSAERHRRFMAAVRAFQLELRSFMYPRVLGQAISPIANACPGCPARRNFLEHDVVPRFVFADQSPSARARSATGSALQLFSFAVMALFDCARWARWTV